MNSQPANTLVWRSTALEDMRDVPNLITEGLGGQAIVGVRKVVVPSARTDPSVHTALVNSKPCRISTQRVFPE